MLRGEQAAKLWRGLGAIGFFLVLAGMTCPVIEGRTDLKVDGGMFTIKTLVPALFSALGLIRSPMLTLLLGGYGCGNLVLLRMDMEAHGITPGAAMTFCPLGLFLLTLAGLWGAVVESNNKSDAKSGEGEAPASTPKSRASGSGATPTHQYSTAPHRLDHAAHRPDPDPRAGGATWQDPSRRTGEAHRPDPDPRTRPDPLPRKESVCEPRRRLELPAVRMSGGSLAMLGGSLVALLVLGGLGWWLFGARFTTFCGSATPGERKHDSSICRKRVEEMGQKQLAYHSTHQKYCSDSEGVPDLKCPDSGNYISTLLNTEDTEIAVFCPGRGHGTSNTPAFDFAQGKVVDTPVEPPKGTWLHYRWLLLSEDPAQQQAALEEVAQLDFGEAYKGELRAAALLALNRPQEALDVLNQTNPDSDKATVGDLKIEALVDLGKYDDALFESHRFDSESYLEEIHYFKGQDADALKLANASTPPTLSVFMIPLSLGDWARAYEAAGKWLEVGGYNRTMSEYAVLSLVLSARLEGDPAHLKKAREVLKRALAESVRSWPFPLLQMVNGEIAEADLENDKDPARLTEVKTWGGLLREVNHDSKGARADYQWVVDNGYKGYFECRIAQRRLEALPK